MTSTKYLKHGCMTSTVSKTGDFYCKNNNMQGLFKIESSFELSSMITFATFCANNVLGQINGIAFCIDGYQLPNKTWFSYDSSLLPFPATPQVFEQNFLKIGDSASGPRLEQYPENPQLWFICEF